MPLDYTRYLRLQELLGLQVPASDPPEHDETLFIIIHQTYELWFKQVLHELERVGEVFRADDLFSAIHTFKRLRTILKTLVGQVDILETMTPMSFTSFRDRLDTASGFQSVQFREVEFLLGYKRPEMLRYQAHDPSALATLERRLAAPTTIDAFYVFLAARGVAIPSELTGRDVRAPNAPHAAVQAGLLRLYRNAPELAILFELMTDFDEGLQEWRYRHVKLVERSIGSKRGTGGSLGVPFLQRSLFQAVFPDLWAIRHEL